MPAASNFFADVERARGRDGLPSTQVAGPEGTVTDWHGSGGINDMVARLACATAKEFPDAGHSIHNLGSADAFLADLIAVVEKHSS